MGAAVTTKATTSDFLIGLQLPGETEQGGAGGGDGAGAIGGGGGGGGGGSTSKRRRKNKREGNAFYPRSYFEWSDELMVRKA